MKRLILFISFLFASITASSQEWIDKSESVFFPEEFGKTLSTYKSFPVFWWNFFVIEGETNEQTLQAASVTCEKLRKTDLFTRVECQQDLSSLGEVLDEWVYDLPLREPPPPNYRQILEETKAKLSFPLPEDVLPSPRKDPLASYSSLQRLAQKNLRIAIPKTGGFFFDETTHRVAIPVQVAFGPSESDKLISLIADLEKSVPAGNKLFLFGPHGSTIANKARISKDLEWVSWVGSLVLVLCIVFLVRVKRLRMALVFVPIFISTGLAYATMILLCGKVHGLTLAFGPGLIGLVIDYGIVALFNTGSKTVWRSNLMGFVTTLASLVIISFSSIPLLKELMLFSIFGFVYGYAFLYCFRHWLESVGGVLPHSVKRIHSPVFKGIAALSVLCCFLLPLTDLKLGIREFDYQDPRQSEMMSWLFKEKVKHPPLFEVTASSDTSWEELGSKREWAKALKIDVETLANYLPPLKDQLSYQQAWKDKVWDLGTEEKKIFEPFWQSISQEALSRRSPVSLTTPRLYLRHLQSHSQILTLWLPNSPAQARLIEEKVPAVRTLGEITDEFPRLLVTELRWIFPLALFSIWVFLLIYYRSFLNASLGLLPFLSSLGVVLLACHLKLLDLSFVSLVGLIMILGLSVDYAIFVIDKELNQEEASAGTTSGLLYAAATTILGFLPLLFCSHKVLYHLGASLCVGTVGTMIGATWGLPWLVRRK